MPQISTESRELSIVLEGLRQTELNLEDLNGLANNSDTRAMALAGATAAIATALVALPALANLPAISVITSGVLLVSALVAVQSAMPRSFHIRGHRWADWKGHIADGDSFIEALKSQAAENDARILFNFKALNTSARLQKRSNTITFLGLSFYLGGRLAEPFTSFIEIWQ